MNIFKDSRNLIVKTLEGISTSANKMAINAQYKAKEISLESDKRVLMNELSKESYNLWQQGVEFPYEIVRILKRIKDLDETITNTKAEYFSYVDPKIAKDLVNQEKTDEEENISEEENSSEENSSDENKTDN